MRQYLITPLFLASGFKPQTRLQMPPKQTSICNSGKLKRYGVEFSSPGTDRFMLVRVGASVRPGKATRISKWWGKGFMKRVSPRSRLVSCIKLIDKKKKLLVQS
ncbi:hypothetical protein AA313_de0208667 [Arthrobotrys entomopaga]|nr:hypothetical protein AA313_de0208667 [Arthrobotrys entomopaga]